MELVQRTFIKIQKDTKGQRQDPNGVEKETKL